MYFKASLFYHRIRKLSSNLTYTFKKKKKKNIVYIRKKTHTHIFLLRPKNQKEKRKKIQYYMITIYQQKGFKI